MRFKSVLVTDKRVRIMNEVISGIRVIKMYAWENAFSKLISKLRRYTNTMHSAGRYNYMCIASFIEDHDFTVFTDHSI